ncbi:MAG: hypothetical protein LWX56_07810 [Ignavibacteria bacterium]|nr:hypothetical protein [Ignavibacteria bacterium]
MKLSGLVVLFGLFLITYSQPAHVACKGNAILGNGNMCLVYSDDSRITSRSAHSGIQHFYYKNYCMDYLAGSDFEILASKDVHEKTLITKTELCPFYKAVTHVEVNSVKLSKSCYVLPEDCAVLECEASSKIPQTLSSTITFRKDFYGSKKISFVKVEELQNGYNIYYDNDVCISILSKNRILSKSISDSTITLVSKINSNERFTVLINPHPTGKSIALPKGNIAKAADNYWNRWIAKSTELLSDSLTISKALIESYKKTLYAVKAATIQGQIPADMTGQFVTNNMPQLYPRDAMMSARVFLLTGYIDEARSIIKFWLSGKVPMKSTGEFYARYDAYCSAVDGGSGARYDEPEWDANGYAIQLIKLFHDKTGEWLCPKETLYLLADFLVAHIDGNGLLYEGGIVEWTAYLPTTNMVCSAALETAGIIAEKFGDSSISRKYSLASTKISDNLFYMYDLNRNTYAAVRFHGIKDGNKSIAEMNEKKIYLWDATMQFGFLWGYQNNTMLQSTTKFYLDSITTIAGGVRYFEALDNGGLSAYGGDQFFFTTASLAQYLVKIKNTEQAIRLIGWMTNNSNIYGLMPERIYLNNTDCSEASPLSWCNAEYAAAIFELLKK